MTKYIIKFKDGECVIVASSTINYFDDYVKLDNQFISISEIKYIIRYNTINL